MKYEQLSFPTIDESNIVIQDNRIIMAKYDMTMLEQKIFLILISTIKKGDTSFKETVFKVKDLAEILEVPLSNLYRDLKKISISMNKKSIEIQKDNGGWLIAPLMKSAEYLPSEGSISLCLNDKLIPYFLQLQKFFTKFELNNILVLDGKHTIRIYQLSKSNIYKKEFTMSLDEFKDNLKLTQKSYQMYGNINTKVILPAIKEINDKTDILLNVETIKKGKKVESLKFIVEDKMTNNDKYYAKRKPSIVNKKQGHFNNFEQRQYDLSPNGEMERKLLGWDDED